MSIMATEDVDQEDVTGFVKLGKKIQRILTSWTFLWGVATSLFFDCVTLWGLFVVLAVHI